MVDLKQYIEEHKQKYLDELFEFLRIPSISADSAYNDDMLRAAEFVKEKLETAGAENVAIHETAGHPVVYGEKIIDSNKPTVLVYGHYDVQPPDPLDLWDSKPFEPEIRDEKIYARGACDDKGQMYMHVKAFEILLGQDELPCNVKFLFEGEEEVGSESLGPFIAAHKDLLAADVVLVSDSSIISKDMPSITVGLRGLSYVEVTVCGPSRDLHSGVYGGAVDNPVNVLCEMIAGLKDDHNKITIPGFYDDVLDAHEDERTAIKDVPFDLQCQQDAGVEVFRVEKGFSPFEGTTLRPTLDVNGMWGGYTGEGSKTVLPAKACAKISMRLVPNQTPEKINELITTYLKDIAPDTVSVEVDIHHGAQPSVVPINSVEYKAAESAMEKTFGKKPIPVRCGGSIPVVATFEEHLGISTILMGFGFDSDCIHSPNEHYGVWNFVTGIETIVEFYKEYGRAHDA